MKLAMFAITILTFTSFWSCKKLHSCSCDTTIESINFFGEESNIETSNEVFTEKLSKKDAEIWCESKDKISSSLFGLTPTEVTECTLD